MLPHSLPLVFLLGLFLLAPTLRAETVPIEFTGAYNGARPEADHILGHGTLEISKTNPKKATLKFKLDKSAINNVVEDEENPETDLEKSEQAIREFLENRSPDREIRIEIDCDELPRFADLLKQKPKRLLAPTETYEKIDGSSQPFEVSYEKKAPFHFPFQLEYDFKSKRYRVGLTGSKRGYQYEKGKKGFGHGTYIAPSEPVKIFLENAKPVWSLAPGAYVAVPYSVKGNPRGLLPAIVKKVEGDYVTVELDGVPKEMQNPVPYRYNSGELVRLPPSARQKLNAKFWNLTPELRQKALASIPPVVGHDGCADYYSF